MRDIQLLDKRLLNAHFETARMVYNYALNQGHGPVKAAALVYAHGFLDGKVRGDERAKEAHNRLHAHLYAQPAEPSDPITPPEAAEEGSKDDE